MREARKRIIIIVLIGLSFLGYNLYQHVQKGHSDDVAYSISTSSAHEYTVHINGEVKNPGTIKVKPKSKVKEVVEIAGGFTEYADESKVNLEEEIYDGMQIKIPAKEDANKKWKTKAKLGENEIININTANQDDLEKLPGIGPKLAERIIEYREKNGNFKEKTNIKRVDGIGDKKYQAIENNIQI
ncbi:helix-hairpin-helix domain-containing protein [Selenomonadales bacterium OttesenSCG-928-I06]|nr:helix-hairpin-helix domain-containing protein [Selenomonadales bacterium OttesenSCG-928-I06]